MPSLDDYIKALRGPILVTGGSGFIGANLFKLLVAHRQDVFAVEKRAKSWRLADVGEKNLLTVDLNDRSATKNLVTSLQPQTVFNCVAYGAYSFEGNEALIYQTNYNAIVQLVQLLSEQPFSAFVQAGSSSEYGTNCSAPPEDATCLPNSDYAVQNFRLPVLVLCWPG